MSLINRLDNSIEENPFKKLIVAEVVKKLPVFYGIRKSSTVFLRLQYVYHIIVCDKEVHMLKNNVLWGCDALHYGTNLLM
jgi:hypothetical protein